MKRSSQLHFGFIGKPVLLLVLLIGFIGCSLDNPGAPMWDLKVAFPLSSERYGLDELVSDSSEIEENNGGIDSLSDGMLRYFFEEPLDTSAIADSLLEYDADDTTRYSMKFGPYFFDSTSTSGRLSIDVILPDFTSDGNYDVTSLSIADHTPVILDPLIYIEEADLIDTIPGLLHLTLTNNTNLQWDILNVVLAFDEAGYPAIDSVSFPDVAAQSDMEYTFDLTGGILKKNLIIFTDGTGPDQVDVPVAETDGLEFDISISPLLCESYRGIVVKQGPRFKNTKLTYEDQDGWVTSAQVLEGVMRIIVENRTETVDSIYIRFPALVDYDDQSDTMVVPLLCEAMTGQQPGIVDTSVTFYNKLFTMELPSNYRSSPDPDPQEMDIITTLIPLSGGFEPNGDPRIADIYWEDSTNFELTIDHYDFEWLWGNARDEVIELEERDIEIDIWEDQPDLQSDLTGNVKFDDAWILIDLTGSTFRSPAKLVIDLTAQNSSLDPPAAKLWAQFTEYVAPNQDTVIIRSGYDGIDSVYMVDMLNHFPEKIEFAGDVLIGRDNLIGSLFDSLAYEIHKLTRDDIIFGTLSLEAPIALAVENRTILHSEVEDVGDGIESGLQSATIFTIVKSTIPLGGEIYVLAGSFDNDDNAKKELIWDNRSIHSIMDPVVFASPEVDPETGRAVSALVDTIIVDLGLDGINKLTRDKLWVRQIVILNATPSTVKIYAEDAVEVTVTAEVVYRVNGGDN